MKTKNLFTTSLVAVWLATLPATAAANIANPFSWSTSGLNQVGRRLPHGF